MKGIYDDFRKHIVAPPPSALDVEIERMPDHKLDGWCLVRWQGAPPAAATYHLLGYLDGDLFLTGYLVGWDLARQRAKALDGLVYNVAAPPTSPTDDLMEHFWRTVVGWSMAEECSGDQPIFGEEE